MLRPVRGAVPVSSSESHDFILVPYNWAGTGHVVYDGSVYYNKFNTSVLIRYSLQDRKILAEKRKYSKVLVYLQLGIRLIDTYRL